MPEEQKAKHTAGPWEVECVMHFGKNYGNTGVRTVSEEGYELCRGSWTPTLVTVPHGLRTNDPVIEANLRLIAAAPELLEACRYMHRLLVDMGHGGLAGAVLGENAIAKAEGRNA